MEFVPRLPFYCTNTNSAPVYYFLLRKESFVRELLVIAMIYFQNEKVQKGANFFSRYFSTNYGKS